MKQKQLAMVGVAVGCGLIAAIAVAKLSAGSGGGPEMVKLIVAKNDIAIGTKLDEKELDNLMAMAEYPKSLAPPDALLDVEQMKNKPVNRTIKKGNPITVGDIGAAAGIPIPEGFKQLSVTISQVDLAGGFALPGSKVDLVYIEQLPSGKARSGIILRDMLVLAVNTKDKRDEQTGSAINEVKSVSLAVNDKQGNLLSYAESKGRLKLILRNSTAKSDPKAKEEDKGIEWLEDPFADTKTAAATIEQPKFDTVVVAKKSIPLNTLLNADNVGQLFDVIEVKTAPEGVVRSVDDLKGKWVVKNLEAGQNLFKVLVSGEQVKIDEPKKETPEVTPAPMAPTVVVVAPPEPKKLPRFEQIIQAGGSTKRVIWLEVAAGKWKSFDSEKDADAFKPEVDEKKDGKPSETAKPEDTAKPEVK
jgi:pilus assembly protein CpaB